MSYGGTRLDVRNYGAGRSSGKQFHRWPKPKSFTQDAPKYLLATFTNTIRIMELKIFCGCGAKYKFDVEPVQGRMPKAIQCPVCGVDGTAQANQLLQQSLAAAPVPAPIAVPPSIPMPPAIPVAPSPPPPLPTAAAPRISLRVGHASSAAAQETESAPAAPYEGPFPLRRGAPLRGLRGESIGAPIGSVSAGNAAAGSGIGFKGVVMIVIAVVVLLGIPAYKFYWRIKRESAIARGFKDDSKRGKLFAAKDSRDADAEPEPAPSSFLASDSTVLVIRHGNDAEVAQACVDFWRDRLRRKLTVVSMKDEVFENGQIGVKPPFAGCVEIAGPMKWPKPQAEALLAHLTQKFNTLGLIMYDSDVNEEFLFGAYDGGQKKFRAESSTLKNDGNTTVEGREWALQSGYKPDDGDWSLFDGDEADAVLQKMGLKIGGRKDLTFSFMLKQ